jgi:hypothetical protein
MVAADKKRKVRYFQGGDCRGGRGNFYGFFEKY